MGTNNWMCELLSSNIIPMKINTEMNYIFTKTGVSIYMFVQLPSMTDGQKITFKDCNNHIGDTRIILVPYSNNTFDNGSNSNLTIDTMTNAYGTRKYIYQNSVPTGVVNG